MASARYDIRKRVVTLVSVDLVCGAPLSSCNYLSKYPHYPLSGRKTPSWTGLELNSFRQRGMRIVRSALSDLIVSVYVCIWDM